jgi:hypothetical protein
MRVELKVVKSPKGQLNGRIGWIGLAVSTEFHGTLELLALAEQAAKTPDDGTSPAFYMSDSP